MNAVRWWARSRWDALDGWERVALWGIGLVAALCAIGGSWWSVLSLAVWAGVMTDWSYWYSFNNSPASQLGTVVWREVSTLHRTGGGVVTVQPGDDCVEVGVYRFDEEAGL